MKLGDLISGLEILRKYYCDGGDGYHVYAEHNTIYMYQTDTPMAPDDVQKMYRLGWFQWDDQDIPPYDQSLVWKAHL